MVGNSNGVGLGRDTELLVTMAAADLPSAAQIAAAVAKLFGNHPELLIH
jgi:hypothetical protein